MGGSSPANATSASSGEASAIHHNSSPQATNVASQTFELDFLRCTDGSLRERQTLSSDLNHHLREA
jgi:hypothetical protein